MSVVYEALEGAFVRDLERFSSLLVANSGRSLVAQPLYDRRPVPEEAARVRHGNVRRKWMTTCKTHVYRAASAPTE